MQSPCPDRLCCGCRLLGIAAIDDQGSAVFCKAEGQPMTDALAGAGNKRSAAGEVE
ncbi:hypothetical protein GGE12_000820 [Rhizobium mongolense]|uniref:Uncharacterized protein n=1 Tax=Rhizobium mongolense TaxID=57676 RepID=A0A7W6WCI7_9HYPH|nr:hypothetical protein [Rhizobium mongolense]